MTTKIFFFKNHAENEARRLVADLLLFFKKALYEVKANGLQLSFNVFWIKSILIHEYQHNSTRDNTNQHESDTTQQESDTSQDESDTSQHESARV